MLETSSLISVNSSEENSEISQESEITFDHQRANTAPAKPINKAEEFKWNSQYSNLERCGKLFIVISSLSFKLFKNKN